MNGTERKSKRQRNGESKLAQKKHRLHRKESKYKDWRLDGLEDPLLRREHRSRDPAELAAESAHQPVTLTNRHGVTPKRVSPHRRRLLEVIMKLYSTAEFARKHGVSDSRIRQLIAEDRVFPRQRLDNGRYIMFANSVIVAPYERTNRRLRGAG